MVLRMVLGMARTDGADLVWRITRTGSAAPDPALTVGRAAPFGASVRTIGAATLLAVREESGLAGYVATPRHPNAMMLAGNLATAVGGRHDHVDGLPDLSGSVCVVRLVARPQAAASRDTQAGADIAEVAAVLARSLPVGGWVGATVRRPSRGETKAAREWFRARLTGGVTHYSSSGEAMVMSLFAGGPDESVVRPTLAMVAAALPGFDVESEPARLPGRGSAAGVSVGVGVAAVAVAAKVLSVPFPKVLLMGVVPLLVAALFVVGVLPTAASRLARALAVGRLPMPSRRVLPARRPKPARTVYNDVGARVLPATMGDYPLARSSFFVGPAQVIGLVCPHVGSAGGAAVTAMRQCPPELLRSIGPIAGFAGGDGAAAHVSSVDAEAGVAIFGRPNSGKSVLVTNLFAYDVMDRAAPTGLPGHRGRSNALVAFENKGEGVRSYTQWLTHFRVPGYLVEVGDPSTPAIDMLDFPGSASERADSIVSMMVYAFGPTDIGFRSQDTLRRVLAASLLLGRSDAAAVGMPADASLWDFADVLLGNSGDDAGVNLNRQLTVRASEDGASEELREVAVQMSPIYGSGMTAAARRSLLEAPRSKVSLMRKAGSWWSPSRPKISWRSVLENHEVVIINAGVSTSGVLVDDVLTEHLSAMLLYSLQHAVKRTCSGWLDQQRAVTIYADELSLLARFGRDVIVWLRNQGRSFGVRPVFATQYPNQLHPDVREAVTGFGTVFWFGQDEPSIVATAVADVSADGSVWTNGDVVGLEPHHAILRATVGKRRQPAVPVKIAFWWDDLSSFASAHGRVGVGVVPVAVAAPRGVSERNVYDSGDEIGQIL